MAGAVASEEDVAFGGGAQPVREPVALIVDRVAPEPFGERHGRLFDVLDWIVRADADPRFIGGRNAPTVAAADDRALNPNLERIA